MSGWPRLLLLLCSALTPVLGCDWQREYGHRSNASFRHLLRMGGEMMTPQSPVAFPESLYKHYRTAQVDSKLAFARDNFHFLFDLWLHLLNHSGQAGIGWEAREIQGFLASIRRQKTELDACLTGTQTTIKRLRRYYRKLRRSLLGRTGGSSASWESFRYLTKVHLEQLDMLLSQVKNRRAA
ncbi:interferon a3-like [Nelusetta ayraudi]